MATLQASRLAPGVWARVAPKFPGPSPYRKVEELTSVFEYGRPGVRIRFANGDVVSTLPDQVWEIDMEIDQ